MEKLFVSLLSIFVIFSSIASADQRSDTINQFKAAGADGGGRCPNGAFVILGRNQSCDSMPSPSVEQIAKLKKNVGDKTCNINELIGVKESIAYALDQFICASSFRFAAACASGLTLSIYASLRLSAGSATYNLIRDKADMSSMVKELNSLHVKAQGKIIKGFATADETNLLWQSAAISGERGRVLAELAKVTEEIAKQSGKKVAAAQIARTVFKGGGLLSSILLANDLLDDMLPVANAPMVTDKYKSFKGFVEFAKLSDAEQCDALSRSANELFINYAGINSLMQQRLSESLPVETTIKCNASELGSNYAVFKKRDGTSVLRSYEYQNGDIKSYAGYELALPIDPKQSINFTKAAEIENAGIKRLKERTFLVFVDPKSTVFVRGEEYGRSENKVSGPYKSALEEARIMALMQPLVEQACRMGSAPTEVRGTKVKSEIIAR